MIRIQTILVLLTLLMPADGTAACKTAPHQDEERQASMAQKETVSGTALSDLKEKETETVSIGVFDLVLRIKRKESIRLFLSQ